MKRLFGSAAVALSLTIGIAAPAVSQELRIGARTEPASMDPHTIWSGASTQFYVQYLGFLVRTTPDNKLIPALAETFKPLSDNEWEFVLRPNIKFGNGEPVTVADVIASLNRARNNPRGSYASLFSGVTEFVEVDARTLRVKTSRPYPTLANSFSQIAILPASVIAKVATAEFGTAAANVGAGPYKFVSFTPGDRLVLERNDDYYGEKARWSKVTFRFLTNNAARVAALLAGDVDAIDGVPPEEIATLKAKPEFNVLSGPSDRAVYMSLDTERAPTPFIKGPNGEAIDKNPLADVRVRRALSMAVDREAIRDRVMDGLSYPVNQIGAPSLGGFNKDLLPVKSDPAGARKLLAEAGWPNGFSLKLQCPSGRLVNDARICQVLGQMFQRVGIKTEVEVSPYNVYISRMTNHAGERGSIFMSTWASSYAGEVGGALENVLHTYDKSRRLGAWNLGHYSNPSVDKLIVDSAIILDSTKRHADQAEAMRIAMEDVGVLPLHLQAVVVAVRKGLDATIYSNEYTIADAIRPLGEAKK